MHTTWATDPQGTGAGLRAAGPSGLAPLRLALRRLAQAPGPELSCHDVYLYIHLYIHICIVSSPSIHACISYAATSTGIHLSPIHIHTCLYIYIYACIYV